MAGYRYLGCQIVSTMANIRDRRDHALATRTFPLITKYVRKLTLVNIAPLECFHWRCADVSVACVGINLGHVAACIRQKARENSGYQWGGVEQRWLLICASGWPISSRAGPQPEAAKWDAPELQVACRESGFNRVFFYERVCGWCQPVWPHGQARHRKDTETGMDEAELLL
jgi:hypothetical protein